MNICMQQQRLKIAKRKEGMYNKTWNRALKHSLRNIRGQLKQVRRQSAFYTDRDIPNIPEEVPRQVIWNEDDHALLTNVKKDKEV